jgi:hypothetical protein
MSITSTFDHRALPYGVFICGDGTYVLHDRRYRPLVKCRGGSLSVRAHYHRRQQWQQCTVMLDTGSATPCSPTERIKHVDRVWFYYNRTSPRFDRKTRKYVQQIVEAIPALAAEINRRNVESSSESPEPVESDMSIHPFPSPTPCEDDEPDEPALIRATPFKWTEPSAIPQRQWLYGRSLIRQQLSLTVAHPGIGKSSLTITEALAIASKRMLLHDLPHQRCRVWLWNGEDPADELQRRITAAALHHKIPPTELDGWLFVDSGRQVPIVIAHATRDGTVIAEPVRDALVATII